MNEVQPLSADATELDAVRESSSLERLIETIFLAELLQEAWFGRGQLVDVLRASVDAFGYDIALESGKQLRHVQLKAKRLDAKTARYQISTRLSDRPAGCVVVLEWQKDPKDNRLNLSYRYFGNGPGEPLPSLDGYKAGKHSKGDATGHKTVKPNMRVVPLGHFERLDGITELLDRLFGPAADS